MSSERQVGFLRLLEALIKAMGGKLASSVPVLLRVVVMLQQAHRARTALEHGWARCRGECYRG